MLWGARDRSCGQKTIGVSIRTMLQYIPRTWFRFFKEKPDFRVFRFSALLVCLFLLSHPKAGYFSNNANPTWALKIASFKCCLPLNDAFDRLNKIHACVWRLKLASCKRVSLKSTRCIMKISQSRLLLYLTWNEQSVTFRRGDACAGGNVGAGFQHWNPIEKTRSSIQAR